MLHGLEFLNLVKLFFVSIRFSSAGCTTAKLAVALFGGGFFFPILGSLMLLLRMVLVGCLYVLPGYFMATCILSAQKKMK